VILASVLSSLCCRVNRGRASRWPATTKDRCLPVARDAVPVGSRVRTVPPPAGGVWIRPGQRQAGPALTPRPAPGSSSRCVIGGSPGDGPWPRRLVKDCSATAGSRIVTHLRRCPGLELDVQAGTCRPAVTAEPAESLLPARLHGAGVSGPGVAPPPGAAHHLAVTLAVNNSPRRLSPQLTGMVRPGGLALS
jgi:hypothetical protein